MTTRRIAFAGGLIVLLVLITACSVQGSPQIQSTDDEPVPTVSSAFSARPTIPIAPPWLDATPVSDTSVAPTSAQTDPKLVEEIIYDDSLSPNWTTEQSRWVDLDPANRAYADGGQFAIKTSLTDTTGLLFFTVKPGIRKSYMRKDVLGIRFRLTGGSSYISPDEMTVTINGSNSFSYWRDDDRSVEASGRVTDPRKPLFSDTQLVFLGINKPIPPRTWVEITIWLDKLQFDPDYTYLTGFYIKSERQYMKAFYVDQVKLLLAPST